VPESYQNNILEKKMNLPDEIYIVVTEHDGNQDHPNLIKIPLALETYLDENCSKAEAIKQVKRLSGRYGTTKIGRLVFDVDETLDLSDTMTYEEKVQQSWA
jgi:hypothetical protein